MPTRSSESYLTLDYPALIPYSRSSCTPSGNLNLSEKTPRPRDSFSLSPDMNHQKYAYTQDLPLLTRERPLSFCPNLTPSGQQYNAQNTPRMRRFSDCLDGSSHQHQPYARPSRNHQLDVSRTANSDLAQSTRRPPPMNHRPSWRYGTDFGLNRRTDDRGFESGDDNECSSPESLRSAHLANYAASISEDGLSSLYECTASDFPKPPPMASPVIRRMRSSPWFMEDSTGDHNLQGLSDQQWRVRATLDETFNRALGNRARAAASSQNELSSNSSLGNVSSLHRLEEPFTHRLPIGSRSTPDKLYSAGRIHSQKGLPASVSEDPRRLAVDSPWSSMYQRPNTTLHQSRFTPQTNALSKNAPAAEHPRPIGRLPRIIRKVASMRSDAAQKSEIPAYQQIRGNVNNVGRKSIPKARSFRSILQTAEADRARERANAGGEWHRPSSWVLGNSSQMMDGPAQSVSYSKFSSDQDGNTLRHQHLSVPLPKAGTEHAATARERRSSGSGGVLGTPFLHRPFGNHSSKKGHARVQEQCEGQDSFMNITPDRAHRDSKTGGKRERMKDFLARASTGMFGWGKQRASRNSSSTRQ